MIYSLYMSSKFVHLHCHSHYSLLDGLSKIDDIVAKAQDLEMKAVALTDHGNMHGAIEFYKKCKKADIKPIVGVEGYLAARSRHKKEPGIDNKRFHITLLAQNEIGYKNLMKMVTLSYLEGFYYKPRMDKEMLRKYSEGVICLSGCPAGELARSLSNQDEENSHKLVEEYQDIFGKDNFFLELMSHPEVPGADLVTEGIQNLGAHYDIPIIGTWDAHYPHKEDAEVQDTLIAINTGKDINTKTMSMKDGNYSFIGESEAREAFSHTPKAVESTLQVAERCNLDLTLGVWVFPKAPGLKEGDNPDDVLKNLAYEGAEEKGVSLDDPVAKKRLDYELEVIRNKGYSAYFLVVADLLRFSRENNIYSTIRGSVAGSLTTYVTGITKVNPLEYKLPFERFLNPERPSAPDIDMDFADNRRDEVIEYAKRTYGEDNVAQIGTFGTMLAKGSIRDVTRALGLSYDTGDQLAKLIPEGAQGSPMTIKNAMEMVPELKKLHDDSAEIQHIVRIAKRIEGCVRHVSVHAAGVVIAPEPLVNYVPLQTDPKKGKIITQYDMHGCEDAGLVKFDFLGIKNLAILADAVDRVQKIRGIEIDIEEIDLADKTTFELLSKGETSGLFQLNGSGMTRFLKELRPSTIHDINAMVALYRPGPMEMIPEYIKRKHNPSLVKYLDPRLEHILDQSYGVITYQDDVMMIAIELAGFSWLEADKLRKAMGKKIAELMEEQKKKLFEGFKSHGKLSDKTIEEIWHLIEPFAAYGFNKAHAASYGRVAYQTAFMKANYAPEYMSALLTADSGDVDKISETIKECDRMDFKVLPPDINESFSDFTVVRGDGGEVRKIIRFGLLSIKNFGEAIGKAIIQERKKNGHFTSIENFLKRIDHKNLNKKSLEALIQAGAFDTLEERGRLMANSDTLLTYRKERLVQNTDQVSLFADAFHGGETSISLTLSPAEPATQDTKLGWEKELLGLYVSGHPLDKVRHKLEGKPINIKKIIEEMGEGMPAVIGGIVSECKEILTKRKNDKMAFIKITDLHGTIEAVVFPKLYEEHHELFQEETLIAVKARVSTRNGEKSLIIEGVKKI
ncbi:MAG: DNA polymerase-3 subunit alpha [Flavobacteriaceae bacterium]|jgi:DNA polymerase-3 subunit alpha